MLAFEDVGSGRSMEVYYKNLIDSGKIIPIIAYTNRSSYTRAPAWVKNKILSEITIIDHAEKDCDRTTCHKAYHRTNSDWFNDCKYYVMLLRKIFGEKVLWVVDMPFPEIEQYMGRYIIQVFHGELFNIGVSYFDRPRSESFKNYALIFAHGQLMKDKLIYGCHLDQNDPRIKMIGRVLDDSLYSGKIIRSDVLRSYGLDPKKRTVLFSPSWEAKKLWAIGEKEDDFNNLREFCLYTKKTGLNLILRPHTILIAHHNVRTICEKVSRQFSHVYFDDSTKYNIDGPNKNLIAADIMITDLSSIASDFLSLGKPVIFLYPAKKYRESGQWGSGLPTYRQVAAVSYTVKDFKSMYNRISKLLLSEESAQIIKRRKDFSAHIFAHSNGSSGYLFCKELENFSGSLEVKDFLNNNYLLNLLKYISASTYRKHLKNIEFNVTFA